MPPNNTNIIQEIQLQWWVVNRGGYVSQFFDLIPVNSSPKRKVNLTLKVLKGTSLAFNNAVICIPLRWLWNGSNIVIYWYFNNSGSRARLRVYHRWKQLSCYSHSKSVFKRSEITQCYFLPFNPSPYFSRIWKIKQNALISWIFFQYFC